MTVWLINLGHKHPFNNSEGFYPKIHSEHGYFASEEAAQKHCDSLNAVMNTEHDQKYQEYVQGIRELHATRVSLYQRKTAAQDVLREAGMDSNLLAPGPKPDPEPNVMPIERWVKKYSNNADLKYYPSPITETV